MFHRAVILIALICALLLTASSAFAQTPAPAGAVEACSPATPCADTPASAGLKLSSVAMQTVAQTVPAVDVAAATENAGFGLAWVVMGLLVLALLYAIVAAVFATLGRPLPALPDRLSVLIPILAVLGLGVAFYLTYVETQNVAAVCGPVGDCNAVQSSRFAKLFGFLPVGLLGLVGYIGIIIAWFVARSQSSLSRLAALGVFGMALFGVLFTIYLTYLELFVILAVCIWCLSSAVLMALTLILSVGPALEALQVDEEE